MMTRKSRLGIPTDDPITDAASGSSTWASYEQGIEAYLQGTSPALLAAYEEFVPNVVALLPSGSQMLEPGSGGLSQRLQ